MNDNFKDYWCKLSEPKIVLVQLECHAISVQQPNSLLSQTGTTDCIAHELHIHTDIYI